MLLARPELTEKILASISTHILTAIVAPMGYGKSTLARAVLEKLGENSYYYAVPPGPHDGHFIWHDLCSSLEAQGLELATALRRLGLPETASQTRQARDLLRATGSPQAPFCLILDDYHYAEAPLLDAFGEQMSREDISTLRYILFSRSKPAVNLGELCLKGQAAVFEQNSLAFSPEEAEAFFRANGLDDPNAALESQRYSEGWPAALWLCLKSWQKNGKIAASGDMDSLLAGAVFAAYSPEERDFLLRLSVFQSFLEADAEKIAAEAGWLPVSLMELRQKNAFLSFDARSESYQFHSIFRDFLRKRLLATAHIDKPSLYRLAAECCFERHDLVSALCLFHKAGRDEDMLRLLDCFWHFAEDRNLFYFAKECLRVAGAIPWRLRLANPLGWLAFVALEMLLWKDKGAARLLDETEERFKSADGLPQNLKDRLQGEIELIRAFLTFNDSDAMLIHYSEAVRLLKGFSHFASEDLPWNCSFPNLSFGAVGEPGNYGKMPERGAQLLRLYNTLSSGKARDAEKLCQAEYLLDRGDWAEAENLFAEALRKCGSDGKQLICAHIAAFGLARCSVAKGEADKALPVLENIRPKLETLDLAEIFDALDIAKGYVAAVLGRLDDIPRWLRDGEMFDPPHNVMPFVFGVSFTVHGKALLLKGEYARLARVARDIPEAAPLKYLLARIHGKTLAAIAAWHTEGQSEALKLLEEALALSRPDGLLLPLAEYGRHIRPLLHRLKRKGPEGKHLEALQDMAGRIARLAEAPKPPKETLTPREKEIMRQVAEGKTNQAIAEKLGVSISAVKYTLARASAKLGAYGRTSAVQRFAELGGNTEE